MVTNILGKSGQAIIDALIAGESDPDKLAALARPGMRSKLREALAGKVRRHHRFMLRLHRQQINALDAAIAEIDREVDANLASFRSSVELLTSIPGISTLSAQVSDLEEIVDDTLGHALASSAYDGRQISARRVSRNGTNPVSMNTSRGILAMIPIRRPPRYLFPRTARSFRSNDNRRSHQHAKAVRADSIAVSAV